VIAVEPIPPVDPVHHSLDPAWIELQRLSGWIAFGVFAPALLVGLGIGWLIGSLSLDVKVVLSFGWVVVTVLLAWLAQVWPEVEYKRFSYALGPDRLEIRRGVLWRTLTSVPKSRVQHIDVAQGPLERRYGLATLSIYTAGTEYARVDLPGLTYERAVQIRDRLLPGRDRDTDDGT
jgi:hypothetical protein